jgi:hypothetical protein
MDLNHDTVLLAIFLWCILPLCLIWVVIYLYLSNKVLIKLDQLKLLNAVNLTAFSCFSICIYTFPHLLSTTSVHLCYKQCCSEGGICYEDVAGARRTQPLVDCFWSLVPSFPGLNVNLWSFFLFTYVIPYCYSLMSTICMKLDSDMHICLHFVFFGKTDATHV